jgi:fatty acid desaturase
MARRQHLQVTDGKDYSCSINLCVPPDQPRRQDPGISMSTTAISTMRGTMTTVRLRQRIADWNGGRLLVTFAILAVLLVIYLAGIMTGIWHGSVIGIMIAPFVVPFVTFLAVVARAHALRGHKRWWRICMLVLAASCSTVLWWMLMFNVAWGILVPLGSAYRQGRV